MSKEIENDVKKMSIKESLSHTSSEYELEGKIPTGKAIILGMQHVLAMFVACVTVPMIVFSGVNVTIGGATQNLASVMIAPTLFSAGVGTIFYLFVTKFKSPMFLASSFAYMAAMSEAIKVDAQAGQVNLWILPVGMAMVGVVDCVVALLIKLFGVA